VKKQSKPRAPRLAAQPTVARRSRKPQSVRSKKAVAAAPVTAADLRALRRELERRMAAPDKVVIGKQRTQAISRGGPLRWNPEPEAVQKSVAQLVLTLAEFLRKLMERQAIRRMEQKTLTRKQVDEVGAALMTLERTIRDMGRRFGLEPEDLNLDLGPVGKLI
jgi:hypothetical protein